jgi:hypothetical protein
MKSEMRRAMVGWISMALIGCLLGAPLIPLALAH